MTTLVHAVIKIRRIARASYGVVVLVGVGVLVLLDVFRFPVNDRLAELCIVGCAWLTAFASRVRARFRAAKSGKDSFPLDLELSLFLLVGLHASLQLSGSSAQALGPLAYVLTATVTAYARHPAGMLFMPLQLAFEALLFFGARGQRDPAAFAVHSGFVLCFGLLSFFVTRAEIARLRRNSKQLLDEAQQKMRQDARLFRFAGAPATSSGHDEERLFRSSTEEVHQTFRHTLDLLKRCLGLHTCVFLMMDDEGKTLRIVELVSDADDIADGPLPAFEGAVGAVVKRGLSMNLEHLKPGYKGLSYYRGPAGVKAFLGVPVLEGDVVRGALCADRKVQPPFTLEEQETLQSAATYLQRAVENERVFIQLERSKHEQGVLYQVSQKLGAARTEEQVLSAGFSAARDIADYDFAAFTTYDPSTKRHTVRWAMGDGAEKVNGLTFADNTSLTAMVVKNRHYLPYRGEFDPQQTVYTRRVKLSPFQSLVILPLIAREDAIGTMALAARRKDAFGAQVRPTLQMLANQLAVSLANAASVRRLEQLATTDGLTGCLNKRALLQELDRSLRSAERFGKKLSLIITDIDHFKVVNDTYGHATGDLVIQALGEILKRAKRETDVVARFGGEEFCVLCEETDTEGARLLAERIREELRAMVFTTEIGKLRVTCSLGVATFPEQAKSRETLFEAADKALYAAKHQGRNRVCTAERTHHRPVRAAAVPN